MTFAHVVFPNHVQWQSEPHTSGLWKHDRLPSLAIAPLSAALEHHALNEAAILRAAFGFGVRRTDKHSPSKSGAGKIHRGARTHPAVSVGSRGRAGWQAGAIISGLGQIESHRAMQRGRATRKTRRPLSGTGKAASIVRGRLTNGMSPFRVARKASTFSPPTRRNCATTSRAPGIARWRWMPWRETKMPGRSPSGKSKNLCGGALSAKWRKPSVCQIQ